ncbi:MAG TPA: hypothetical protein VJT73_17970 [Polyangiaceae bacterium]|nr:hypothetical protein [Polyangiaceae bacterium]
MKNLQSGPLHSTATALGTRAHNICFLPLLAFLASGCATQISEQAEVGVEEVQLAATADSMLAPKLNRTGFARSATPTNTVDQTNPFFASLGTNGRSCGSCHLAGEGWSITPTGVKLRFLLTGGTDPLFAPHDGANAPALDVSTVQARRAAYSLLLDRAVIRVGLPVKPTSEFELVAADDPYGHASAAQLSLFRRPLPTTNLRFLSTINWDGRNTVAAAPTDIHLGLKNQSNGATVNHAQAAAPIGDAVREAIVAFETTLTTAQIFDFGALDLSARGANGGPCPLLTQPFAIGANAPGPGFDPNVFTVYDAWTDLHHRFNSKKREQVADGQRIFNTRAFTVVTPGRSFETTCSGCHTVPNVGSHSTFRMFDVGISKPERRAASVPLYTFRNKATGELVQTTDPGRALISGLWADMNKFKVPGLRGLAARAPYFHDGSVTSLAGVVAHYDQHFNIGFSTEEKSNLEAFLEAL